MPAWRINHLPWGATRVINRHGRSQIKVTTNKQTNHQKQPRNEQDTFPCLVAFEGYDWRNVFRVRSEATGRMVTLETNGKWDHMTPALTALITKYRDADSAQFAWSSQPAHPEQLSASVMKEI